MSGFTGFVRGFKNIGIRVDGNLLCATTADLSKYLLFKRDKVYGSKVCGPVNDS